MRNLRNTIHKNDPSDFSYVVVKDDKLDYDSEFPTLYDFEHNMETKSKDKFIKGIEKIIRSSNEYSKEFIPFIKYHVGLDKCSFFNNLNIERKNVKLEIHHSPLTLYEIVTIAIKYYGTNCDKFLNVFKIAEIVMKWHWEGIIGLIPLSNTVHKLVHSGDINIPLHLPYGNKKLFYETYNSYFPESIKDKYEKLREATNEYIDHPPEVLDQRYIYLNGGDGYILPTLNKK